MNSMIGTGQPRGYALAILLGLPGGALLQYIGSPLPWFLGPMLTNAVFALMGVPVVGPTFLRPYALPVLGVMLGSAFMPEIFRNLSVWAVSLAMIPAYAILSTAANYLYYRRVAHSDPVTSYFASVPGGLNDMILLGEEYGGDTRQIALAHSMRIIVSVLFIALLLVLFLDVSGASAQRRIIRFSDPELGDAAILLACAVIGPVLGRFLRFPARQMLGPLLLSAAAHLAGLVEIGPPTVLSLAAQFVLGICIGARFAGVSFGSAAMSMFHALISASLALAFSAVVALVVMSVAGVDFFGAFLGYAPGGMMEMSLLALAIGQSVAYVTVAHTMRYVFVMLVAPVLFHGLRRRAA